MEFDWLRRVLNVKEPEMMGLVKCPPGMQEVDKLLAFAFRRRNWLPAELSRDVNRIEMELIGEIPVRGTVTGQLLWWMIHH